MPQAHSAPFSSEGGALSSFYPVVVDVIEEMRRAAALRAALARAPGGAAQLLDPRPLVRVRVVYGRAVAATPTHILHEWVRNGEYHCRWDEKWQVHRVPAEDWAGESLD